MIDEELRRLLEANTERIEKRFDAVDKRFEAIDKKIDDTAAVLRRHAEVLAEAADKRIDFLTEMVALLDEKVDRKTGALELRMDQSFADTQAMIKFSHAELDRRVRFMEQTLQVLEDKFATLNTRVERLEETTRTEN
jgi:chaperonin cofactor prefoldin